MTIANCKTRLRMFFEKFELGPRKPEAEPQVRDHPGIPGPCFNKHQKYELQNIPDRTNLK